MKTLIHNPVFRWIAVIPGALLAAIAAQFPWHWLLLIFQNNFVIKLVGLGNIERAGYGFLTSFVFICVAARIAPSFKHATAVVSSLFFVLFWSSVWLFAGNLGLKIEVMWSLVAMFLAGVGIWAAWRYGRTWWEES